MITMDAFTAIQKRRSVRKFLQKEIPIEILHKLVDAGRVAPSGANLQCIEYIIINEEQVRRQVFSCLHWAGYIAPKGNPVANETPTAYIVMVVNTHIKENNYQYDMGCAAENIAIAATAEGLGSCILGAIEKEEIKTILRIPEHCFVDLVVALGYPKEQPVTEEFKESVRYFLDESGTLHVPKRRLKDIMHMNRYRR